MKIEMAMKQIVMLTFLVFLIPFFAYGASDIAIFPLMNQKSVKKKQVQTFENLLEKNLEKEGLSLISISQSTKKLKLTTAKVKKCIKDIQCLAQSGQKLSAGYILSGYLGQKGNQPFASLNLINVSTGEREKNWKFKIPTNEKDYPKVVNTFTSEVIAIVEKTKPKPAKVLAPNMSAQKNEPEPKASVQETPTTAEEGNVTPLPDKDEPPAPPKTETKSETSEKSSIRWDNYWAWGLLGTSVACSAGGGMIFQSAWAQRNQYLAMTQAQQKSTEGQAMKNQIYSKVSQTNILLIASGVTAISGVTLMYFGWGSPEHPFFSIKGNFTNDFTFYPNISSEYTGFGVIMRY